MMKTTIQEQDGNVVAILEGSLDTAVAAETEKAMDPLNDVEGKDIIIDCTDLEYISSAGLRIFLGILQNVEEKGVHVYIKGVNAAVNDIFTITGFSNIFEFI
jgi:anti-sigma B factor antagonist